MRVLLVLGCFFCAVFSAAVNDEEYFYFLGNPNYPKLVPRIINGQNAVAGQFPWQAAILVNNRLCGGALIYDSWVLTSANCVGNADKVTVTLGAVNLGIENEPGRIVVSSVAILKHKNYDARTYTNDIALISLSEKVNTTDRIKPIALPTSEIIGTSVIISGFGTTREGVEETSWELKFISLRPIDNNVCFMQYDTTGIAINENTLCCSSGTIGPCLGDMGGALVENKGENRYEHVGIASFFHPQGCAVGKPPGFLRTARYVNWINSTIDSYENDDDSGTALLHSSYIILIVSAVVIKWFAL